ncbi:hypothetical protein [Clostridium tagluense]|uniref:hypothetical protein n=1 Tax=Clostridium tagluense TaxID=360422 RepID=UPI001C6E24C6|nr:hypothetical protein [Clostridium tagluense]MBW9159399.1 hypothetical protein [Clostridium tagluense]WLC68117.1 hypothetical protein KTC93_24385 [Clostridium tagluense]
MSLFATIKRGLNRTKTISVFLFIFFISIFAFYIQASLDFGKPAISLRSAYENTLFTALDIRFIMLIIAIVGPLIISFAFGDIYFDDLESNCVSLILTRENKKKYHRNNLLAVFILSFIIMLIPLLINLALCLFTYPLEGLDNGTFTPSFVINLPKGNYIEYLRILHPLAYNMFYILTPSIIFALFACITYCLSMIIKANKYLCCFVSYGLYIGSGIILDKLHLEKYKFSSYINILSVNAGIGGFIKITIILIAIIFVMYLIGVNNEIEVN